MAARTVPVAFHVVMQDPAFAHSWHQRLEAMSKVLNKHKNWASALDPDPAPVNCGFCSGLWTVVWQMCFCSCCCSLCP